MELAFVAAVGGIGFEDVAVTGFQFFQDAAFVDYAGATVVGEGSEEYAVFAVVGVEGAELLQVFAQEGIGLSFGQLYSTTVGFSGLDLMSVANVGPVLGFVERFKFLDYQNCSLKERQFHNTSFGSEGWRNPHKGD